ncbi:MAG: insulinase family protein [SAR86 cluster bacterium]|uniref:Insulinase family protein n=1 Tax=SAR86 cluster bacterium TaxID=2030880 RepID=A0A937JA44_9GAMM|nr:insulinase family protein [SAR86 cluster bacterium]
MKIANTKNILLSLITLSSTASFAYGQTELNVPDIEYDTFTLSNGLTVVVHEDRKVPMVAVNVWYHVGSKNEKVGKTGFAHLFEHLMFNGTENYNAEYFEPFEKIGATDQNGTTNNDRTNYFQNVPTNALDLALWMESERMGHILNVIDQEKLDEQRGVVQNEKRQGENQPYGQVFNAIGKAAFPEGHPYSWSVIGSMADLNAATLDDVKEWFETYYGPTNAVIALAGDIDLETAKIKVQEYFGDIQPGPPLTKPKKWIAKRTEQTREVMEDNVPQTRIYKVWNVPEDGTAEAQALDLASSTLAGSKNSPLYQELVYKTGLATGVSAFYYGREIAGLFIISATVAPEQDVKEVESVIDATLEKYLKTGPNSKLLKNTKTSTIAGLTNGLQRIGGFGGKSDILATYQTLYGDAGAFRKILEMYLDTSANEVKAASNKWLSSGDYVLTIVPAAKTSVVESTIDRSKGIPYPTEKLSYSFPKIQSAVLNNGSKLVLAERNDLPLVQLEIVFNNGYAVESEDELGLVNFTMSMVDEGTKKYNSLEFAEMQESLGSGIGFGSSIDTTYASMSSLKVNLEKTLDLFKEGLLNPIFPQVELDKVKKRWLAGIDQELNSPASMANREIRTLVYGSGHPYAKASSSGTKNTVETFTREDLQAMYAKITNPNDATFIVTGDISLADATNLLNKKFSNWKSSNKSTIKVNLFDVEDQTSPRVFLIDKPGAIQSYILAAQLLPPTNSNDDILIDYMNYAIAGSFTSRLNMNLREDKSWSYGVRTSTGYSQGQRLMRMTAPVQTDKTAPAILEILREYDEYINSSPINSDELSKIKNARTLRLPGQYETLGALLGGIEDIVKYNRDYDYLDTIADKRNSIKLEDVQSATSKYLDTNKWTWVIVGDLNEIEDPIRELNIGPLEIIKN